MKDIEYRGWDKKCKNMFEWKYLLKQTSIERLFDQKHYILLQFTGLKDYKGRKMFEGDIIENKMGYEGYHGRGEVVFWLGRFCVKTKSGSWPKFVSQHDLKEQRWEVIGNVYENSELLKK